MKPRDVSIFPADNGFVVKVGCLNFVVQGDTAKLTEKLSRYLNCDTSIVKEFLAEKFIDRAFLVLVEGEENETAETAEETKTTIQSKAYQEFVCSDEWYEKKFRFTNGFLVLNRDTEGALVTEFTSDANLP